MDEADDPDDPDWPVHPAAAFYGLWPRFAVEEDAEESAGAGLGRATFRAAMRHQGDEEWVKRAREVMERAARDIEGLN